MNTETKNGGIDAARCTLERIEELVQAYRAANDAGDYDRAEEIADEMRESPLSVLVRQPQWYVPGHPADSRPTEYELLMSTGGPAVRIVGELSE